MNRREPLVDSFGRMHTNLRVSVTDRCNIRCFYCMPAENVRFKPRHELLTFEEIERFVRVVAADGRQQGPADRRRAVGAARSECAGRDAGPGARHSRHRADDQWHAAGSSRRSALREAGLKRLNISLDSLSPETFFKISRREGLEQVLEGIFAAQQVGFEKIRLNAVAIRGITEEDIVPLGRFAREHGLEMRFIEFMPLDADGAWDAEQVLSGAEIREVLEREIGPLVPLAVEDPSQPATDYAFADGRGRIGFINPGDAAFLPPLQSAAADGRGPGAQLPVFDRGMGRPRSFARRRIGRRSGRSWSPPALGPRTPVTASIAMRL